MKKWRESPSLTDLHEAQGRRVSSEGRIGCGARRGEGLPSAHMHDDLLGHQGEAEGAKEKKAQAPSILARTHHCKILYCVKSFSQEEKKRREKRGRGKS